MRSLALFLIALTVQGQSVAAQSVIRPVSPPVRIIAELAAHVANLAPALNGRRIYYGTRTGELWLYDVASKRSTRIADDVHIVPTSVAAQGELIAFMRSADGGSTGRTIWTMPLDPGTGLAAGPARRASVSNGMRPSLSPDGKWIAYESLGGRRHLAVIPSNGGSERVLLDEIVAIEYIKWSPDQQWLYFSARLRGSPHDGGYLPMRIAVTGGKPELIAENQFLGDALALEQLFLNLLLNAARSLQRGGSASLTLDVDGADARIVVTDTGSGIPPEDLAHVLDPFFSTKADGTGLGLPIARQIATAHGGSLKLESVAGEGTRVEVRLPLAIAAPSR